MKFRADHEMHQNESSLLHKMTLGHSFKEDRNIFKNIHSLLKKPKKKYPVDKAKDHDPSSEKDCLEEDLIIHSTADLESSPLAPRGRCSYDVVRDRIGNVSPTRPQTSLAFFNEPSASTTFQSASGKLQDTLQIASSSTDVTRWNSNEISVGSSHDPEDDDDVFLHTLLPPQISRPRPQRWNSHSSIGSNGASRSTRSTNLISGKRDGKSLRGSRTSLHRMNSFDNPHRDFFTSPVHQAVSPKKAYQSKIDQSAIPFQHYEGANGDQFPRISAETLKDIIQDELYKSHYESYQVVDCRFAYEYKGGHISNALHISSREELESEFIHSERKSPTLLIFHCEFSSYRGPMLASHLRNCDRMLNYDNYPDLFYPDILILDGGYKGFFDKFPSLCYPRRYVGMDSSENLVSRDQELERFRQDSKKVVSRNSSLYKLTSVPSSTRSSIRKGCPERSSSARKLNYTTSPGFKYEAPPKLSLSRYSNDSLLGNSDDSSSGSRLSINSSPNLSTNKMLMMDGLDGESCYSFDEGDSTFTTPVATSSTPTNRQESGRNTMEPSSLNLVKKSLFPNILREEQGDLGDR
ncbi:putative tyrosine protein phosphatase MIH1 TDEL_0B06890 [Torulaspora delbrueckii]|uniref:M-phase inducer phosphatase n=1 Tax=Torulaspora delbrueckii TaxID=4950 RepID=G8ZQC4_TORDE|nr:hypothetical protein TDEL_0B06890 [Torulaspora delbrueckii]CCE90818.1 hypothetical protein TDEL_0B06890 [Torulaspora delbrueckii]